MQKIYSLIFSLFVPFLVVHAQQQFSTVGAATSSTPAFPNATCFNLTPSAPTQKGAVWNNTTINLNQSFDFTTSMYFGSMDEGADGIAFVLQGEGTGYIGNEGAGIGYHRFPWDVPGPVPSFIVEFDTYMNGFIGGENIADPAQDHLGFMSISNAYHTSPTALQPPQIFTINIEDNQWHDVRFTWNATTKNMTVVFTTSTSPLATQTFSYTGDIVNTIFAGNPIVYWGFTASTGGAQSSAPGNAHKVCIKPPVQPCVNDNIPPVIVCPPTVILCYNTDCGYTIPQLTATDNCEILLIKYVITGATNRWGLGKNASGYFNPGTSTIEWKVYDKKGNVSTCTTQVIVKKLKVEFPNAYCVNPGGHPFTIYKGYGSTSITLTATPSGGTAPYSYLWSTGATTQSITVSPSTPGYHSYTVRVTDAQGCVVYKTIKVKVKDVRKNNKVELCHVPPGNPGNRHEITVAASAVPAHLAHGDYLGECQDGNYGDDDDDHGGHHGDNDDDDGHHGDDDDDDGKGKDKNHHRGVPGADKEIKEVTVPLVQDFLVVPNPSNGIFEIRLSGANGSTAQVIITGADGKVIETRSVQMYGKGQTARFDLTRQTGGIYFVKLITREGTLVQKLVLKR